MNLYDFAFVSSKAATSIEFLKERVGNPVDRSRVYDLANKLDSLSQQEDFGTRLMLSRLFWPNQRTVEEIMSGEANVHANLFAKDLRKIEQFSPQEQIEIAEYCIRLSRLAMKYSPM